MSNLEQSRYQELVRQALQVVLAHSQSSLYDMKEQKAKKTDEFYEGVDALAELIPCFDRLNDSYNLCVTEVRSHLGGRPVVESIHPFIRTSLFDFLDCKERRDSLDAMNLNLIAEVNNLQAQIVLCEAEHKLLDTTISQVLEPPQVCYRLANDSVSTLFGLPVDNKRWGYYRLDIEDCAPVDCERQGNNVPFVDSGFQLIIADGWDCQCGVRNRWECRFCVGCDKERGD
jgi:hypothetical protein